jgi:hypothetical protein
MLAVQGSLLELDGRTPSVMRVDSLASARSGLALSLREIRLAHSQRARLRSHLVPQDPTDESAEKLPERIRAQQDRTKR